jgi:hypothetical protein
MDNEADDKAGLLGKVAKFIKNPTLDWADLDRSDAPQSQLGLDAGQSRQALKDMIQNKRRNDAVRRREFDMLRMVRRKGKEPGNPFDATDMTSSYSSSQLPPDTSGRNGEQKRKQTLRKIDEIEAQLSRSWFRKPGDPPTIPADLRAPQPQRPAARSGMAPGRPPTARGAGRLPSGSKSNPAPIANQPEPPVLTQAYRPQTPMPAPKPGPSGGAAAQAEPDALIWPELSASAPQPEPRRRASVYDNALEGNLEVVALRQDPEIEEAAISFANGDETTAELTLLKLVSAGGSRRQDVQAWLTLFDLYRVTGKSRAFDDLVPEFTGLFGRSAPQWEHAQNQTLAPKPNAVPQAALREGIFTWTSPAQFNARALAALTGAVSRGAPPWRIDWRAVKTVEPDALPQLGELFTQWADTPAAVQFLGGERLLTLLAGQSPAEDKHVNPAWWLARLSLLRLMNAPGLFDQAALDYCITYEISPPAWTPPKSSYTPLTGNGQSAAPPDDDAPSTPIFAPTTITGELLVATGIFEAALEGEILGGADRALAGVPQHLERIRSFDFDCRALRRVDFSAAGELLNWSITQQGQGRAVTFRDAHRLLAAFFSVIGINAAAQVVLRKD